MAKKVPLNVISALDHFFNTYNFYYKHLLFFPNGTIPFGNWEIISMDIENHNYQLKCFYSYDNGKIKDIAKCTVNIFNGSFNQNEITIEHVPHQTILNFLSAANYY